ANRRIAFLSEASALLADSLDYQTTLERIAQLAVPHVADWCSVELLAPDGVTILSVALAHVEPEKTALAREVRRRFPPEGMSPRGIAHVIRTGETGLF